MVSELGNVLEKVLIDVGKLFQRIGFKLKQFVLSYVY